ncbi:MAG: outer membrane protein assembly factor BamC [Pasteurellaceae bacterium]|nr:outer membrane protein assembly factor BamC [Pasteurellaceae bacterium]
MKQWLLPLAIITGLTACSNDQDRQLANDSYQKRAEMPTFERLDTAGVNIIGQNNTYQLPAIDNVQKADAMDIRPPATPIAIIGNSVAQFDGERASIIYPVQKKEVYNLQQISRLLGEKGIKFTQKGNDITTDWAKSFRVDEIGDVQLRYQISEMGNQEANALVVTLLEAKRNNIVFTPTVAEKERYTSDFLNTLVGELNSAYQTQMQQVQTEAAGPIEAAIVTDANRQIALAFSSTFNQSWSKLGEVLPQLGFEIKDGQAGRGYRELKYKPTDPQNWARLGVTQPNLEKGTYSMQLSAYGKQSAVVITDNEKHESLTGDQAQAVYQALQVLMTK